MYYKNTIKKQYRKKSTENPNFWFQVMSSD